jgi:hypothetical protein
LPNELKFDEKMKAVDEQVQELLQKGAFVKTEFSSDKFISNIFQVQKKNGKLRPVINLRKLNQYVEYHHFKQENLKIVLDLIQKKDFMTSADLTDAYFSIEIDPEYRKFLFFMERAVCIMFLKCFLLDLLLLLEFLPSY